jgi:Ni/Fe-hydrogenase subunit HybB-like protein
LFWIEMATMVFVPVALLLWARRSPQPWLYWTAPLLVVLGVGMNRFTSTLAAQNPAWEGLYVPSLLEWVSTIGILSGALFLWLLAVRFLARPNSAHAHH